MSVLLAIALAVAPPGVAPSPAAGDEMRRLSSNPVAAAALAALRADDDATFEDQRALAETAAPGREERARAVLFMEKLRAAGFSEATIDGTGNVVARLHGSGGGPTLMLSAHLDSVFPRGDDVSVRNEGGRWHGRGLADDARGLAALLSVARAMHRTGLRTVGDILFVATVGEEGLGNTRGAKAALADHPETSAFITIEPPVEGEIGVANGATGSRRFVVTFSGPGGHSFANFGRASAIHAAARAIAEIDGLRVPREPKTTFNVGLISGGTSINTIASNASFHLDIRSNGQEALEKAQAAIMAAIDRGVRVTNRRWGGTPIVVRSELVGDRRAGGTPETSPLVQAALAAEQTLRGHPVPLATESSDAGAAVARTLPAIVMGGGGASGNLHSGNEWYERKEAWLGPQAILLTAISVVGLAGGPPPALSK